MGRLSPSALSLADAPAGNLIFEPPPPVQASDPNRADIALFVGFVGRRTVPLRGGPGAGTAAAAMAPAAPTAIPAEVLAWLIERGWATPPLGRQPLADLLDVPVPVDTWDVFDALFDWDRHEPDGTESAGPGPGRTA